MTFDPHNPSDWRRVVNRSQVFVSGPMFSAADKAQQLGIAAALEREGFPCVVPHRDGIEVAPVMELLNDPELSALLDSATVDRCIAWVTRTIACLDVYWAAEACTCTVLNIDGRVPDEGSLVEATAAWFAGRPVVVFQTSAIRKLGKNNNPMIGVISGWTKTESTLEGVVRAVKAAKVHAQHPQFVIPAQVANAINAGRHIASARSRPFLEQVPPEVIGVLEPTKELREMCRFVVNAIIAFSQAQSEQVRETVLLDGIEGLQDWVKSAEIKAALKVPIPC